MANYGNAGLIKIGAAWVSFGTPAGAIGQTIQLGYTKGGIEFAMETQGHEVLVDQEGISPVSEALLGRRVTVTCPMAETSYNRMHNLIPDSEVSNDATGVLLQIKSGLGKDLMTYADQLVITSKADENDYIILYMAAPIASLQAPFVADRERIWPVQFKGYVPPTTSAYAGILVGLHAAS